MRQPPGYVQKGKEELVCKLRKSIYDLKQSSHCWNEKLCNHLKSLGFKESGADSCVCIQSGEKAEIEQMKEGLSDERHGTTPFLPSHQL